MELPVYELKINPEQEIFVDAIAMVEQPAIESDFLAFSKTKKTFIFQVNDEKMELIGGAMIPDIKIYRKDDNGEEYNVFFSKETIRQISQVFFKKGFQSNMNLDHTTVPAKSYIFQSYIVDESKGIASPKGLNLPDGSWVVGVKVEDKDIWNDIKEGKRKGFSVEGVFQFFKSHKEIIPDDHKELIETLKVLNTLLKNKIK